MEEAVGAVQAEREADRLVYPVYSRRSGGLSLGVNLFPQRKECPFACPYCEVLPFKPGPAFSSERLRFEFDDFFERRLNTEFPGTPLNDICLSGNGEPSLSPQLCEALELMAETRRRRCPDARLVMISNAAGFQSSQVLDRLEPLAKREGLRVWIKLDAGTDTWYRTINQSSIPYEDLLYAIERWTKACPSVIQTMVCAVGKALPARGEFAAYSARIKAMLDGGALIDEIHLYTLARPPVDPRCQAISEGFLAEAAQLVREGTEGRVPVRSFGSR